MQTVTCTQCGLNVRVAGMAAICPECGLLVVAPVAQPRRVEPIEEEGRVLDLLEQEAPAPPPPEPTPIYQSPQWQMFESRKQSASKAAYWAVGVMGVLVVLLVAALLVIVSRKPQTITVTVPAPAPVAPQSAAPTPRGSEWFVEPPTTQPRAAPVNRPANPVAVATAPQAALPSAPTTRAAPRTTGPHVALASLQLKTSAADPRAVTDQQITTAIQKAAAFLLTQFATTRLRAADDIDPETFAGMNALATYALLQAGKNLNDNRLGPQTEFVRTLLERLKEYPMKGNRATYSRSLRISALTVFNRPEDRATINEDLQWLLRSSMGGAFSYDLPPQGRLREHNVWDNSNSQYGALGVLAASEAGFAVPTNFWQGVEQHWISTQLVSGGWAYGPNQRPATLSMTAAGTNMLFLARDQLSAGAVQGPTSGLSTPLTRALEWLDEGENAIRIPGERRGYVLFGLERAGLAGGLRYLGNHDWYLVFAGELARSQAADGSWMGTDGPVVESAFNLLFLLRGRQPVLFAKLRFDGAWNNRPRDVSVLTRFTSHQLERTHNWQTADIQRNWWDWLDAPVLVVTSDRAIEIPDSGIDRLRAYAQNGGLIFFNAERDSEEFKTSVRALAQRLFPQYPIRPLPNDHLIYSSVVPIDPKPPMEGVTNGSRMLLVLSTTDLARTWQVRPGRTQRLASDMGLNIGIYAAGRRDLASRLLSTYVLNPTTDPIARIPLARIQYSGNWDPEPAGWVRLDRLLQQNSGIGIDVKTVTPLALNINLAPVAHMTGTEGITLSELETTDLRVFVTRGGVLLIDACGGATPFATSADALVRKLAGNAVLRPLPEDHPIQTGPVAGTLPLPRLQLRNNATDDNPRPRIVQVGAGYIILTPFDLSSGLVGVNTLGIRGYQPEWCAQFVQNVLLWVTRHSAQVPPPPN